VVCFDTGYSDEHLARFSVAAPAGLSFTRDRPESCFDIVLLLDVLEHVPNDRAFLASIVGGLLAPGGVLLASVPAYPSLFARHDVDLGHHRRYRPDDLLLLLRNAGLDVATTAGLFHSLLSVRVAQKLSEIIRGVWTRPAPDMVPKHADTGLSAWNGSRWLTGAVLGMLYLDNWLSTVCARRCIVLPGLSVWALAKKP
jgi:SAM-dependent methyltransferase